MKGKARKISEGEGEVLKKQHEIFLFLSQ